MNEAPNEPNRPLRFEDVISSEHLRMIAMSSGGFRFAPDQRLAEKNLRELAQTGTLRLNLGRTDLATRTIYYNPLILNGSPDLGVKPMPPAQLRGFAYHESGHHAPEVVAFRNLLRSHLTNIKEEDMPEAYRKTPAAATRFLAALDRHLHNSLTDIWLESYLSRRPYYPIGSDIAEPYTASQLPPTYQIHSKPEQLMQTILRHRYVPDNALDQKVDPEVFAAFGRILESGALAAVMDRTTHENYFAKDGDREAAIRRKFEAYRQVFLPEYLKLVEEELEERKQQRQAAKQKPGQQDQPQPGQTTPADSAVPPTAEEETEIANQLLKELEAAGHQTQTLSEEEENAINQLFAQLEQQFGQTPKPQSSTPRQLSPEEQIAQLAAMMLEARRQNQMRGLADAMQVREQSVAAWQQIKEQYRQEIESTAAAMAEVFLDDRRKRLEFFRREGEIVPGLEYETVAALISGDLDPATKLREVQNPEFLETEIEFIVDTSGSMGGENIRKSIELMVIAVEAFKRVREDMADENLLIEEEQPFRVGVTKFTTIPQRVTKLDEPLSDKKELEIIERSSMVGGGTSETETIRETYRELSLRQGNIIKIVIVLSDGHGDKDGVAPLMRQIEEDDEVIFLAIGLGQDATEVVKTYLEPLADRDKNVFGHEAQDPAAALPYVTEFLKREVARRRKYL